MQQMDAGEGQAFFSPTGWDSIAQGIAGIALGNVRSWD
jgi:hypothetical protein